MRSWGTLRCLPVGAHRSLHLVDGVFADRMGLGGIGPDSTSSHGLESARRAPLRPIDHGQRVTHAALGLSGSVLARFGHPRTPPTVFRCASPRRAISVSRGGATRGSMEA